MSRIELILIIILIVIILAYLSLMSYFIISIYKNLHIQNNKTEEKKSEEKIDINSPFQTDFFNKSAEHAEKVLFGKVDIQEYGEPGYYGNNLMDIISKLNDETKKSIVVAMKYMCIEPVSCRNNEKAFRIAAVNERVPVWFIILREATKKVIPDFMNSQEDVKNNVVPIYKVA